MPVQKRSRVASFALNTLASAVIGAAILPAAYGAGLGKLTVLSALGQPLRAEIELTAVTPEEAGDLTAKLAPVEAFKAANIDFNPALMNLRFDIEQRGDRRFIRVTSSQPVNEPFVDMLLELTWGKGRLVREYTFLLDPADTRSAQAPQVAAPVDVANGERAATPATGTPTQTPTAQQRREEQNQPDVRVKRGDTLSEIASELKPAGISLDMMLVALYRANPEAFSGKNMNRLKSGAILSVPGADAVRSTSSREARRVVIAHAADFNAYRARLAGQVAASTPAKTPEAAQSATGKITTKVQERPTAANEAQDQLKLSKAGEGSGKTGAAAAVEDKIAKDQQVADAAARVKELEKNVSDLEKLMTVKNQPAAEAQDKAALAQADKPAAPQPMAPVDLTPKPPVAAPVKAPLKTPPDVPAKPEPGIVDAISDNLPFIGVALAALLAAVGLTLSRRRKAQEKKVVVKEAPPLADVGTPAQSLYAETGGQSVDTSNSVFNSNFAPSASQLDTNEVDPVAEADVYIAYGRDLQAEEILKEALRTHPERHAVRLKLLEIYATRKDTRAFEAQASELFGLTRGQGDDWAQAAALGRSIDAENPLYSGGEGAIAGNYAVATGAAAVAATGAATYAAGDAGALSDFSSMLEQRREARAEAEADEGLDLDLGQPDRHESATANADPLDFDFDNDATARPVAAAAAPEAEQTPTANLMDFDFGDDRTAVPDAAPPPPPSVADSSDAEHFDFDLGGLADDTTGRATDAQAPAAEEAAQDASADRLDLAFDEPATLPPATAPGAPSSLDDLAMDFDLDLPGADKAEATAQPADDPLAELDLMDFNLPDAVPPGEAAARPAAEPSLGLDEQDFALPETPHTADQPAAAPPPEFDLSGIDLELDEAEQTAAPDPYAVSAAASAADDAPTAEPMSALQMEMDTKLDLAIAYQEIGDKEGARELLDEVIRGGSDDQVARANQMLAQLG